MGHSVHQFFIAEPLLLHGIHPLGQSSLETFLSLAVGHDQLVMISISEATLSQRYLRLNS